MSLFLRKQDNELDLVLQVESTVVRGFLVIFSDSKVPIIIAGAEAPITWRSHSDTKELPKAALKSIIEVVDKLRKHKASKSQKEPLPRTINNVHYVLTSPWISSESRTIDIKSEKEIPVSKEYVISQISADQKKIFPDSTGIGPIEQKIFDVKLNGYSVSDWEGKTGKAISISYSASMAHKNMVDTFVFACSSVVERSAVYFHSALMLKQITTGIIMPDLENYALLHVHGEFTDTVIVHDKISAYFGSFQNGIRTFIKKISSSTKTDLKSSESLLSLHAGGHLDSEHAKETSELIVKISAEWTKKFEDVISARSKDIGFPQKIILTSSAHDTLFESSIREEYPAIKLLNFSFNEIGQYIGYDEKTERKIDDAVHAVAINSMRK